MERMNEQKLNVKDMITVGIFAAIMIVVKTIVGFIGVVPFLCAVLPAVTALVLAPIYVLFVSKVEKFGMITMLTSVLGLVFSLAGYGWQTFVGCIVIGLLADIITKKGDYCNKKLISLGYSVFSLWGITLFIIIWMMGDAYFQDLTVSMGAEFSQAFEALVPWWSVFWLGALTFVCGLIGVTFGMKFMKKHFNRNGEMDRWN